MNPEAFLALLRSLAPGLTEADLRRPVAETPLDSLDLLTLRSTVEARRGRPLTDEEWLGASTLAELGEALR